jgi:hypothetical protein
MGRGRVHWSEGVIQEASVTPLSDNRAVGNSRLAHMDVLSVSGKGVTDASIPGNVDFPNELGPTVRPAG